MIFSRFFGGSKSSPKKSDRVFFGLDLDHQKLQTVVAVVAAGAAVVAVVAAGAAVIAVVAAGAALLAVEAAGAAVVAVVV